MGVGGPEYEREGVPEARGRREVRRRRASATEDIRYTRGDFSLDRRTPEVQYVIGRHRTSVTAERSIFPART